MLRTPPRYYHVLRKDDLYRATEAPRVFLWAINIELKMTPLPARQVRYRRSPNARSGTTCNCAAALSPNVGSTGRFRRGASQARDVPGQHVIGGLGGASLAGDPNNYSGWNGRVDLVTTAQNTGGSEVCGAEAVAGMERPIVNLITSHAAVDYSISSADTNCM